MLIKAPVKAAGKHFPRIDISWAPCHLRGEKSSTSLGPHNHRGWRKFDVRAPGGLSGPLFARRKFDMTSSRLFPPLRAAAVATVDVRRNVPGISVGVLAMVAVALAVTALLLAQAAPARADDGPGGVVVPDSPIGNGDKAPLTPADRDFVVRVRLAGLWEIPAGVMAAQKGVDPQVRQVGKEIADQHVRLDQLTRTAASRLGIALPNRPTYEQRGWLTQMRRAQGADFDHAFVDRLRA